MNFVTQTHPFLGLDLPGHTTNINPGKLISRNGFSGGILWWLHQCNSQFMFSQADHIREYVLLGHITPPNHCKWQSINLLQNKTITYLNLLLEFWK